MRHPFRNTIMVGIGTLYKDKRVCLVSFTEGAVRGTNRYPTPFEPQVLGKVVQSFAIYSGFACETWRVFDIAFDLISLRLHLLAVR